MPGSVGVIAAAHRGLSAELPENTLAAFQAAVIAGFPALEMDLRVTADGEVVVLHDAGIERTTNGNGRVADMRYDDLRSYHTPVGPVPRLDDLFRALREWDGLWNLELKTTRAVEPACHLIQHHHWEERVLLSSFDPKALETCAEHLPEASRALIVLGPTDTEDLEMARRLGCRWLNADAGTLTPAVAQEIRREGFRLGAYTLNDPDRALAIAGWGAECVITDRREVLTALASRADPKPYF